ncbi:type VII secretion target [Catellatospora citrea]|uniref:Excreted virulence factor EspC (Type VII ESX diderm) n=1 Tax=Catellatospora citrea TaxID=53366 RepID=A0A8J3KE92_9ACTN|nr:hypothetical protein [Catellatospora citrea]RKE08080.1 excreted virulence factor EspC (type VII ESX diderm) [Catellatospora citrea]GIF98461.1 hypothetical protein Cci01nite_35550 [Catellatospora citrea]
MPTADGPDQFVTASLSQLAQHAQTLRGLADQAEQAFSAAKQVTLDREAYGLLCALIPAKLVPLQARIATTMQATATDLDRRADALYRVIAEYDQADRLAADRHQGLLRDPG